MKRTLLVFLLLAASCSKNDDSTSDGCNCEQATFGYTLNGDYNEFSRYTCVSFLEESGYTIENGIIMGPMEDNYNDVHNNFYKCD